ncbi:MAG: HDOD domain-containing protein [Magnetococcus sp. DMHC-6]
MNMEFLLDNSHLPSLPMMYHRLCQAIENPRCSVDHICQIITEDPGLTARLLKIANSTLYHPPFPVLTVSRAVALIGTRQIKNLVMATYVIDAFSGVPDTQLNMKSFWQHSLACGLAARVIAIARREVHIEQFYLTGLLHDLGLLTLFTHLPKESADILTQCQTNKAPLYALEKEVLGFNHAELGGKLLQQWQLPKEICLPIQFHHTPDQTPDYQLETAIIHVADLMALSMRLGSTGERHLPPLSTTAFEKIGLPVSTIPNLLERVFSQFQDANHIFTRLQP